METLLQTKCLMYRYPSDLIKYSAVGGTCAVQTPSWGSSTPGAKDYSKVLYSKLQYNILLYSTVQFSKGQSFCESVLLYGNPQSPPPIASIRW